MRHRVPFLVAAAAMLGHVGLFYRAVLKHTGGTYCYPIDDAFIHLAIARHLAFDGVYGVTKHAFAAASSSIVWPFLLALVDRVFGDHVTTPLVLNLVFGVALVAACAWLLRREAPKVSVGAQIFWLVAIVFLTPLPTLVASGMEHTLHAAATILLVAEAARALENEERASASHLARLAGLAALTCAARYEGLFVVAVVFALAIIRLRVRIAGAVVVGGAAPVLGFGLYSVAHGSLLLPNSVVLKGRPLVFKSASDFGDFFGGDLVHRLSTQPHLLVLTIALLALFVFVAHREGVWTRQALRLFISAIVTVIHVQMASLGWFFRYEAYLVALDVLVIALALSSYAPAPFSTLASWRKQPLLLIGALLVSLASLGPLGKRAAEAADFTPLACRNIYQQQVQSARFLARHFGHDKVAINDIGAVAYFGEEDIVDIIGLASLPVARAKKLRLDEPMSKKDFARLTQGASVAIVYDEWAAHMIPSTWVVLGRWRIEDNRSCAFPAVTIYATSGDGAPRVIEALREFAKELPESVHQEGRYLDLDPAVRASGFRAEAGDVLAFEFVGAPDLSGTRHVEPDGSVYFEKIGEVRVRGMTVEEATQSARARIDKVKAKEGLPPITSIVVRTLERHPDRFYAAGQLSRPGLILSNARVTAEYLLGAAGGPSKDAQPGAAYVWREDATGFHRLPLAADAVPGRNDENLAAALESRDILVVP